MASKRASYRNPVISALIFALLYLVISNVFYWVMKGHLYFSPFNNFAWAEYVLGTVAMGVCVLLVEFIRNLIGKD
jgi:hypothetical protein